jgi:hypothetical protein
MGSCRLGSSPQPKKVAMRHTQRWLGVARGHPQPDLEVAFPKGWLSNWQPRLFLFSIFLLKKLIFIVLNFVNFFF